MLFEEAKSIILELSSTYHSDDLFKLVNNDVQSYGQGFLSYEDFLSELRSSKLQPYSMDINEVIERVSEPILDEKEKVSELFLVSDFQKSKISFSTLAQDSDSLINYFCIPLDAPRPGNVFIDSCWMDSPAQVGGQIVTLNYRLNQSEKGKGINVNSKLIVNGRQRAIVNVESEQDQMIESYSFKLDSAGLFYGQISIDDHPITFDDQFYFSFKVKDAFKVTLIQEKEAGLELSRFFDMDSAVQLRTFSPSQMDYKFLSSSDLVIANQLGAYKEGLMNEIRQYMESGGSFVFIPKTNAEAVNSFMQGMGLALLQRLDTNKIFAQEIDVHSPLFENVFELKDGELPKNTNWPYFHWRFQLPISQKNAWSTIIKLTSNQPLLLSKPLGEGKFYIFTASLQEAQSNFFKHALFIPTFYNMLITAGGKQHLYYPIDASFITIQPKEVSEETFRVRSEESGSEFIPLTRQSRSDLQMYMEGRIRKSGNYTLERSMEKYTISFNYLSDESALDCYNRKELIMNIEPLNRDNMVVMDAANLAEMAETAVVSNPKELWKIFVILAVLFFLIEVFLLRFLK
jgi:hypothetical protein